MQTVYIKFLTEADRVSGFFELARRSRIGSLPGQVYQAPREALQWARQTFDEEEFLAQVHEVEATGGSQLEDFLPEVEARARQK